MGRLPVVQNRGVRGKPGRDHNTEGFSIWMAGGGLKSGHIHGATDDFGHRAVQDIVTQHDFHATLLQQMGIQHDQFSFNTAIAGLGNAFNYSLLDPLRFANGALFFGARAPQMLGVRAAVVQNNHMTGTANKEHRFREHLLWFLESPAYFRAPEERFLQYDARAPAPAGIVHRALVHFLSHVDVAQRVRQRQEDAVVAAVF